MEKEKNLLLSRRAAAAPTRSDQPLLLPQLLLDHVRDVEAVGNPRRERHAEARVAGAEVLRVEDDELGLLRRLVEDVADQEARVFCAAVPAVRVGHERGLPAVAPLPVLEGGDDGLGGVSGQEVDLRN